MTVVRTRLRQLFSVALINVVLFCAGAEILGLLVFYYQHGWLFYVDPYIPEYPTVADRTAEALTSAGLHPYFGPTHRKGAPFDIPEALRHGAATQSSRPAVPSRVVANNFGFLSPHDYPFAKSDARQFTIGIFGGSVGVWFCQVGVERLLERLQQTRFFRDKELVPLCLSHEGYKQPQQLLLLAYFLSIGQQLDLVINIDGFNEVALGALNSEHGWDVSMPSFMHLDPMSNLVNQSTLTPAKLESLSMIARHRRRLNQIAQRINGTRLASVYVLMEQYYAIVNDRYRRELAVFAALPSNPSSSSFVQVTPSTRRRDEPQLFEDIARQWIDASILMNTLLLGQSIGYFHFLQPNQYYTTRPFAPDEAAVALNDRSPFGPNARKGYPYLERLLASPEVKQHNLRAFSAVHAFDGEARPVYMDDCCHYTLVGNQRLADFIVSSILQSSGPWNASAN
jgi:hypothetical protein